MKPLNLEKTNEKWKESRNFDVKNPIWIMICVLPQN